MTRSTIRGFQAVQALTVDAKKLRAEVRSKYREVAETPDAQFHFHTGRPLAERLGYPDDLISAIPAASVASFAGVANPVLAGPIAPGSRIVDVGSGGGFDSFAAAHLTGTDGVVVGVDMTPEMLERARSAARESGIDNVGFREGLAEDLPVGDRRADLVISNGVLNLVADKLAALAEINRVLRPGGILQFGDIANGQPVPDEAVRNIDLWAA